MAVARRDTSTIEASPVRSRFNSAAVMPPASVIAPIESPNAARCITGNSSPGGVSASAMPPRDQNAVAS